MPAGLRFDEFAPLVGSAFGVGGAEPGMQLGLVDALPARHPPLQGRMGFALSFRGPAGRPLSQGTHTLHHQALGELSLFLVPLGPQGPDMRYEAIFN